MKKFMVTMVMVLIIVLTMVTGMAEDFKPAIYYNDLENMEWNDGQDFHITMYVSMPEFENVNRLEISVSFNDNEWQNYNEGMTTIYDHEGKYIDSSIGSINKGIDCSSKDINTIRKNMTEYVNNFDFEKEHEETGIRYYSIWF